MALDLRKLDHFLAVFDEGSFARAASRKGVSQPAISKSIAALEASLLVCLFERGRHGARPTPFGEALATRARIMLAEETAARRDMDVLRGLTTRTLAIGVSAGLAREFLPRVIARFHANWPDIIVECETGVSRDLFDRLQAGDLEIVVSAPGASETRDIMLRHRLLFEERDMVVCGSTHPLSGKREPALAELARYPWIVPRRSDRLDGLRAIFEAGGASLPRQMIRAESADIARGLLVLENFICLATGSVFHSDLQAGRLATLTCSRFSRSRAVTLSTRSRIRLGHHASQFRTMLIDEARNFGRSRASW